MIKLKEVNEQYNIINEEVGLKLKQFMTVEEMYTLYDDVKSKKDSFNRHFSKVVMTAKLLTNVDDAKYTDKEIYDICAELGLIFDFKLEVEQYEEIDRMIASDESTYNLISDIVEKLTPILANADKQTEVLKEVLTNANK